MERRGTLGGPWLSGRASLVPAGWGPGTMGIKAPSQEPNLCRERGDGPGSISKLQVENYFSQRCLDLILMAH